MEDNENIHDEETHQETDEDAMFDTDETTTTLESDEENENESIEDEPGQNEINGNEQDNETRKDSNKERNGTVVQDIEEADPRITGVLQGNEQEETDMPLANFDTRYPEEEVAFDQVETSNKIENIQGTTT